MDYITYYSSLEKPFFAPPEWVFGLAWGIIYPLLIVATAYTLYMYAKKKTISRNDIGTLVANIILNLAFTPVLLQTGNGFLGYLILLGVVGTLLVFMYRVRKVSNLITALLVPYALWGAFATILFSAILLMN